MSSYPLTNFEILRSYQNKPRLNGVHSRNDLPNIRDGAYLINLEILSINQLELIGYFVCDWW